MNTLAYEQGLRLAAMGRRPAAQPGVWYTQPSRGISTSTLQFGEFQRVSVVTCNAASVPGKGGIHKKGADADGDGKTGEGKKKYTSEDLKKDDDKDGKPDVFEVSVTDSSSEYTSDSDDEKGGMYKKRSNASAGEDCGCGCDGDPSKKKSDCGGLKKGISKASKKKKREKHPDEGKIHRANDGKHDYYVYWKGRKISFGDASMPNRNHNDKARANFNSRHGCSEKKDKTKAGYWGETTASCSPVSLCPCSHCCACFPHSMQSMEEGTQVVAAAGTLSLFRSCTHATGGRQVGMETVVTEELRERSGVGRKLVEGEEDVQLVSDVIDNEIAAKQAPRVRFSLPGPSSASFDKSFEMKTLSDTLPVTELFRATKPTAAHPDAKEFLARPYHEFRRNRFLFSCADEPDGYNQNRASGWKYTLPETKQ